MNLNHIAIAVFNGIIPRVYYNDKKYISQHFHCYPQVYLKTTNYGNTVNYSYEKWIEAGAPSITRETIIKYQVAQKTVVDNNSLIDHNRLYMVLQNCAREQRFIQGQNRDNTTSTTTTRVTRGTTTTRVTREASQEAVWKAALEDALEYALKAVQEEIFTGRSTVQATQATQSTVNQNIQSESEYTDEDYWIILTSINWLDKDEQIMNPLRLSGLSKPKLIKLFTWMQLMAIPLRGCINEVSGVLDALDTKHGSSEESDNFLFHIIAKGRDMYNFTLVDPTICTYLLDQYQPLYTYMKELIG